MGYPAFRSCGRGLNAIRSFEAPRVHHAARRRGGVAALGAGTADGNAGHWASWRDNRAEIRGAAGGIPARPQRSRFHRRPRRRYRISLGGRPIREPPLKGIRTERSKGGKNENVTSSLVLVGTNFYPVRMAGMVLWATA